MQLRTVVTAGTAFAACIGCGPTEPDYPRFDGPSPTVSDVRVRDRVAEAIVRDPQGAATVGRTDYTYVYFHELGSDDSQVSFARSWTWTQIDDLTWRVTIPDLRKEWPRSGWHVADVESNILPYVCITGGGCEEVPVEPPLGEPAQRWRPS